MLELVPRDILNRYEVHEWRNAFAVLTAAHPHEWADICSVLRNFELITSDVLAPGGRKSPIANKLDGRFYEFGWEEKSFSTQIIVDDEVIDTPTHKVDCFKNKVALEVEWNNKDPFFDRDLNNFRLLFDLRAIDAGVIITRCDELQAVFDRLGKGSSYGSSTTRMGRLIPRIEGGAGGGCPVAVFGIRETVYVGD